MDKFYILFVAVFMVKYNQCKIRLYGKAYRHPKCDVDMATVVLKDNQGNIITGCISDSLGCFNMNDLTSRNIYLQVSVCIGYANYTKQLKADKAYPWL